MVTMVVNGVRREIQAPTDTPLLYILRNDLQLSGPQFGCGLSQCGACSVLLDGKEIRSCTTPLSGAIGKEVTTLEGLPARWAQQKSLSRADAEKTLHPVQQAWIEEQTPLCGFCQNGMMIKATELLERDVLQKRFCQRPNRSPISSSFDYSAFQSEGFPDELNLSKHIPFRQPPHLAFPDHVQNLIALNRPPRSIERSKTLAGIHPPLDPSMVLFHYII